MSSSHVLALGRTEDAEAYRTALAGGEVQLWTIDSWRELIRHVMAHPAPISRLDLVGHGGPGFLFMGEDRLSLRRIDLLADLSTVQKHLAEDCVVALLGCTVGISGDWPNSGPALLATLASILERELHASTCFTGVWAFGPEGYLRADVVVASELVLDQQIELCCDGVNPYQHRTRLVESARQSLEEVKALNQELFEKGGHYA